jgi:hypothetical protein
MHPCSLRHSRNRLLYLRVTVAVMWDCGAGESILDSSRLDGVTSQKAEWSVMEDRTEVLP